MKLYKAQQKNEQIYIQLCDIPKWLEKGFKIIREDEETGNEELIATPEQGYLKEIDWTENMVSGSATIEIGG